MKKLVANFLLVEKNNPVIGTRGKKILNLWKTNLDLFFNLLLFKRPAELAFSKMKYVAEKFKKVNFIYPFLEWRKNFPTLSIFPTTIS